MGIVKALAIKNTLEGIISFFILYVAVKMSLMSDINSAVTFFYFKWGEGYVVLSALPLRMSCQ